MNDNNKYFGIINKLKYLKQCVKNFKTPDDVYNRRFWIFCVCASIALLGSIVVSIYHFDDHAWEDRKRIGFILESSKDTPGWGSSQQQVIRKVCADLNYDLLLRDNVRGNSGECRRVVEDLAAKGVEYIFLTNSYYLPEVRDLIVKYPRVHFFSLEYYAPLKHGFVFGIVIF